MSIKKFNTKIGISMLTKLPSKMIVYIQEFRRWYYHNFFWERVRSDIFKRDKYTCQLCKRKFQYRYRRKFVRSANLECDHIIPRSMYQQMGYKYDTLENKIKV